jgi:hypothetical protein
MAKNRAEFPSNEEDDDGHVRFDLMMDNAGEPRHRTYGLSSASADEDVESGASHEGPEQWPEWKHDDQAYWQCLDESF